MYGLNPTVNPGRHRRQKAKVKQHAATVRQTHEQRREEAAGVQRKAQYERASIQAMIVGIKTALGFTVAECELPVWPDHSWYRPRTFKPEYFERAMRYFNPTITEEFLHRELSAFREFWQIEYWVGARYTMVESMEFVGPWYRVPSRSDTIFPLYPDEVYYFDMSRIKLVKEKETDEDGWKYWKVKTPEDHRDEALKSLLNTEKNTSEGDGLKEPEIIWNGNSSEHFTPRIRKHFWRRFIAALTNQRP